LSALVTVLVVSGGGFQGLGLVKALRESSRLRVVLADVHRENVTRYFADRSYLVPEVVRAEEFVAALLDICRREDVAVVMPATGFELLALAERRERFAALGVSVAVSDPPFLRLTADKRELYGRLGRAGLPVLPTVDLEPGVAPPPLIGKPVSGWGSRGLVILRTAADIEAHRALVESHVFQPYLEDAEELSADFAIDFGGVPSPVGLRRRLRTSGGFAVVSESASHPVAQAAIHALIPWARAGGASGILNVQILTRGLEVFVSDVNPRPGTSFVHWIGTGLSPALHVCASVSPGLRPENTRSRTTSRSIRYLEDLRVESNADGRRAAIRGVVFDLDDTLIPQKRWIGAKLEALHALHADALPDRVAFLREAYRLVEERAPGRLLDEVAQCFNLPARLRDELVTAYRTARPAFCEVFPDVLPTLETLKRLGLRVAVLTDNPPDAQRAKIEASPLRDLLDAVVFTREEGGEKPDPRGFAAIAGRLGLPARALAMVGDNPHRDMSGASAAGFGRLFLLRRPGTLFSFDAELFRRLPESPGFEEIGTLHGLCALVDS
jgi:FMN phosphatase YigB (HAD superfamily)/predicted ATP-grasp superfamily ATP-dependent carboligase